MTKEAGWVSQVLYPSYTLTFSRSGTICETSTRLARPIPDPTT